MKMVYNNERSL